ncbi:DDB1- and CUL4-associated factor 13-like [Macrosteles quadrilineatus]|uniref:DDB1- and CUL4-associated factor 13-like n=1 Tax=Macrosteles quadrilineatus TaxID=74068 RepID=UPI0023E171A5|nr:DDB1- and CUL4-associated factor 13-like [Macrosteles quadrilineatus]XP_054269290.1 DDB1- and CUL4-associated factor 13-like [Macrosteles quadrilineatus]XP_054290949.1 DDB1- and CUL4-associated factor 13-like [Macrosteles quadrilineatus]
MKVKVLTRNPDHYLRETKSDIFKAPRNYDPSLHPFEAPREYVRALNAVKLERVFAKPFIGNLDGHRDAICCLKKHPNKLALLSSGDFNGEVRLWDLSQRQCARTIQAHDGCVRGLTFNSDGTHLLSIGDDKTIKIWNTDIDFESNEENISTIISKSVLLSISFSQDGDKFATCGDTCQLWEESRSEPIRTLTWDVDSLNYLAFNPVETYLLAACGSDRSVILYDTRESGPLRKLTMALRTNQLAWNPMEAFTFTCANEDYNLYTYDSRNLKMALNVHKDHTSAVTCVDYAPTGREFVSGSYDKSVRIYEVTKGHSRDIYHTKRMQRLTSVAWTMDNKYIATSSDEMNIRLWKARASEKLGVLMGRERAALNYNEALKKKFANHPQIRRIARHRQVPKHIYNAQREQRTIRDKTKRKEANRRTHSKPGTVPFVPERKKHIVTEKS